MDTPSPLDERPVYLDNNATTPLHPRVADAMRPFLGRVFGNPSSSHAYGRESRNAVDGARRALASLLGAGPAEIVFTSGGSEADNLALSGVGRAWVEEHGSPGRMVIGAIEHPAVSETAARLRRDGWMIDVVAVNEQGRIDPQLVEALLGPDTALASIMHANNETGTVNPIGEIADRCRAHGVLLHTDAAQSVGKIGTRVEELGADLVTVAAHKFHGPKGVGALYVRPGVALRPVIPGGGQEQGLRAGTENLIGIAGLGAAAELAEETGLEEFSGRVRGLRDLLHERLAAAVSDLVLNGHPEERLPNTLNVSVPGLRGPDILAAAPGLAASTGSACHEGGDEPSPVLTAMGRSHDVAMGALRLTLGLLNTREEIERAADELAAAVERLRG